MRNRLALALLVTGLAGAAEARIVSYAPVTERVAAPAHQRRTNRRFVLVEAKSSFWFLGNPSYGYPAQTPTGRLVVYDTEGREPPREVFPQGGDEASFGDVAAHEGRDGQLRILAVSNGAVGAGENIDKSWRILLSTDTGRSFLKVTLPAGYERLQRSFGDRYSDDFGGPFCRGRDSSVRTGTDETPFVLVLQRSGSTLERGLVAIDANGTARLLARLNDTTSGNYGSDLAGQDASGSRFLVSGSVEHPSGALSTIPPNGVYAVGIDGSITRLIETVSHIPYVEGWITPDGAAYVEVDWQWVQPRTPFRARRALYVVRDGQPSLVAVSPVDSPSDVAVRRGLFSIPTADFSGAWVVTRAYGKPTILARHDPRTGLVEAWRDEAGPEVDALYAGASGRRLIVQVHRRRQLEGLQFWDPALATWEVGQPAPRAYDELFVVDQDNNGFVHVDVDGFAEGAPFWFDSGLPQMTGGVPAGRLAGVDVTQEWGVVRGTLLQRLVLPASAHTDGRAGSAWRTDLLVRNGSAEPVDVSVRFAAGPGGNSAAAGQHLRLEPGELRVVPDALLTLFGVQSGHGALFLTPEPGRSISATSRTYTASGRGSYGMGLDAVEASSVASLRFPVTFSAGFLGSGFRSNFGIVDPAGTGTESRLLAASDSGPVGRVDVTVASAGGVPTQVDDVAARLGLDAWRTGALELAPLSGEAVPYLIAIDGRTNDPSSFRPDLPAPLFRTLPAIVHAGGANGAEWRSDLFLYNAAAAPQSITFEATRWDGLDPGVLLTLTLQPHEARVVRDVLPTLFGMTGVARLQFISTSRSAEEKRAVRVTSRTYAESPDGGTYGFALPPFNAFQCAVPGEALEVLLLAGPGTRTNLALVEQSYAASGTARRVKVEVIGPQGLPLDSFDVNVPVAGGIQVDDLFRARGLPLDLPAAVIRISPSAGTVGAYATVIDQGTNDPSYFAAGLAASW